MKRSVVPALILHGWNLSGKKFTPLVVELKKNGYDAYSIDLPGFGNSTKPQKPLTLSDYVEYVYKYIKSKNWEEVIIVGHSFGGRIGIKFASTNPSFLKALILTGTPGYNPVQKCKVIFFLGLAKLGDLLFSLPILKNAKEIARKLLYKAAQANDFYTTDITMQDTFKNIVKEEPAKYLAKIKIPTLLIWGENDQITPLWIGQKMESVIPNAKLVVIPNSRHGVPWTNPKEFVDAIIRFLNDK